MRALARGQGAIRSNCGSTYCPLVGQGATEYLVLLAVVLIVALVSVALLGFFPGMASDAQVTQSKMYWTSASPIAITEWAALTWVSNGVTYPYYRLRNNGQYPIRITGVIGGDGGKATTFVTNNVPGCNPPTVGTYSISTYYYLAPGEERYFAWGGNLGAGIPCDYEVTAITGATSGNGVGGAASVCTTSAQSPGVLQYNSFGFEYIEYIDGQQITKRQMGRPLVIKCGPPST